MPYGTVTLTTSAEAAQGIKLQRKIIREAEQRRAMRRVEQEELQSILLNEDDSHLPMVTSKAYGPENTTTRHPAGSHARPKQVPPWKNLEYTY